MIALVFFLMLGLWYLLGMGLWRWMGHRIFGARPLGPWRAALLILAWMIAPWIDQIVGAWVFERECEALVVPDVSANRPVAVGPGVFFDDQGRRTLWTSGEVLRGKSPYSPDDPPGRAYTEGIRFNKAFEETFPATISSRQIRRFPNPIIESSTTRVHAATGVAVYEFRMLGTPGGWVSRVTGVGSVTPSTCVKKSPPLPDQQWFKFN